jgi:hypothetical protein
MPRSSSTGQTSHDSDSDLLVRHDLSRHTHLLDRYHDFLVFQKELKELFYTISCFRNKVSSTFFIRDMVLQKDASFVESFVRVKFHIKPRHSRQEQSFSSHPSPAPRVNPNRIREMRLLTSVLQVPSPPPLGSWDDEHNKEPAIQTQGIA